MCTQDICIYVKKETQRKRKIERWSDIYIYIRNIYIERERGRIYMYICIYIYIYI